MDHALYEARGNGDATPRETVTGRLERPSFFALRQEVNVSQRTQVILGIALAGALAGACAMGPAGAADRDAPPGPRAVVEVTNNNWLDVTVYAIWSGTRARLGTVTSRSTRTFALPRTMLSDGAIQLLAAPIGSPRTHRTDPILVYGGERIELNVETSLSLSNYTVRPGPRR